jgi:guanylate kinase
MKTLKHTIIISGPSGAGEDSVINGLEQCFPVEHLINTTTRTPREGDIEGNPYHFISQEEFLRRVKNNEFVEYTQHYNGNWYGMTLAELERANQSGRLVTWKIEYQGLMAMKKKFPDLKAVLIIAPSLDVLEQRIRRRGGVNVTEAFLKERMDYTREWLKHTDIYDLVVVNEEGKLHETIAKVAEYIRQQGVLPREPSVH